MYRCRSFPWRLVVASWLAAGAASTVCAVLPAPAGAAGGAADLSGLRGSAKLNALIDTVAARQRAMVSFKADFVQRKTSSLLLEQLQASGELRFLAPDRVRWDFTTPDPMVIVVADDTMTTFLPESGTAQRVKVSDNQSRLMGVFAGTQNLDEMKAQFRITLSDPGAPAPYHLTLDPIHRAIRKRLDSVLIDIDRELMLPVVVEYHEADGDSTRFEFLRLEINPQMEEDAFRLEFGDSVVVEEIDATSGVR